MASRPKNRFNFLQWWNSHESRRDSSDEETEKTDARREHLPVTEATFPQIALHIRAEFSWRINQGIVKISPEHFFHSIARHSPYSKFKTDVIMLGLAFAFMKSNSENMTNGLKILTGSIKVDLKFGVKGPFNPEWFVKEFVYEDSIKTAYHDWEGDLTIRALYRPSQGVPVNLGLQGASDETKKLLYRQLEMLNVPFGEEDDGSFFLDFTAYYK